MISFTHFTNTQEAKDYFAHLSRDDYFGKEVQEALPVYEGKMAERMGLDGMAATKESFYRLCENRNPLTGEQLTARMRDDRRIMTDVTVDVNKPVTLAALYDDRVEGAVNRSLRKTITGYIEPDICVRVRKGGKDEDRESGNGLYVIWPHETTRPEDGRVDPHKHRHVTFLNVSYDPVEKTNKACQFGDIVRDKRYYQAVFNSYLAAEMKALGYGIEKDGNNFRLAGLSRATVEKFSRRTATINAEAERLGITDAASKSKLGRRTREKKSKKPVSMEDLQK
jgi:conjugative relaxase-like TrwC/TraI family protein